MLKQSPFSQMEIIMTAPLKRLASLALIIALTGCATTRSMYYNSWEKLGYAKRERLVDNVKEASAAQGKAKQEFANALEQFRSVVNFEGGDLEKVYNKLNKSYETCEKRATAVNDKITGVKRVADALFKEWKSEIGEMKDDPSLKAQSQSLLDKTKNSYSQLVDRMDSAAATMPPVLTKFHNRVLFLKHNLNAQAIASLRGTEVEIGADIDKLIKEMEASIKEADDFIAEIQPKKS
jgi:hypothetical protein